MAFTFTNADAWVEFDVIETPSIGEFSSYDKPLRGRDVEIWLAPRSYIATDGVMDSLPVEIFEGEWLDDGTFHRDRDSLRQAILTGTLGQSILKYAPRMR